MAIVPAAAEHLDAVQRLLKHAQYRYIDLGREDVPALLAQAAAIGEEQGAVWGFLGIHVESRPVTLPPHAPTRANLRVVALQRGRRPTSDIGHLLTAALDRRDVAALQQNDAPLQLLCYGGESWLNRALDAAGFAQIEAVQFFELDRLPSRVATLPPEPRDVLLAPAHPDHLDELARLDSATFPPLWHFSRRDLLEMLLRCRMQIAWVDNVMAGYSAMSANSRHEVQLARLAVAPAYQGRGVGRALLGDAIRYAAAEYRTLVLNTQAGNVRSQRLYRGYGFHTIGVAIPVLARTIAQPQPNP